MAIRQGLPFLWIAVRTAWTTGACGDPGYLRQVASAGTPSRAALRRARTSAAQKVGSNFIPHVQGLRAIAVLAVVLYHFWPGRLSGGYVGVDIFFVISGFLITAHLARELNATGRVNLGQFWARRARRLLPASLLVLLFLSLIHI